MSKWESEVLAQIASIREVEISPYLSDGTFGASVPIWVVRAGDELYIRSYRGQAGKWFRQVMITGRARLRAGTAAHDVVVEEVGDAREKAVSDAYRAKYQDDPDLGAMVAADVVATTLRVDPYG